MFLYYKFIFFVCVISKFDFVSTYVTIFIVFYYFSFNIKSGEINVVVIDLRDKHFCEY